MTTAPAVTSEIPPATGDALARLLELLPVHHRARDVARDGTPGPLTELLTAVAGELAVLEADVERLQDAWFVETCEEWLLPYLAELVGMAELPPELPGVVSRRSLVANVVATRRRKGTVAAIEQVARDATGWPTRAVEFHPLLVTSAHVNHVRLDRPAAASLRDASRVELGAVTSPPSARGALDPVTHTAEVRTIPSGRGRYGIDQVAVFPYAVRAYVVGSPGGVGDTGEAVPRGPEGGWSRTRTVGTWHAFDPLGRDVPLFAPPVPESELETLATEAHLPVPLRPRRLLALLRDARAGRLPPAHLPLGVRIGVTGVDLEAERVRVCGLEDLAPGDAPQVLVDPVRGRLRAYREQEAYVPATVFVHYAYGGMADVGAGTYDRSLRHDSLLQTDLWRAAPEEGDHGTDTQTAVLSTASGAANTVPDLEAAFAAAAAAWAAADGDALRATYTISAGDSNRYAGDLALDVPAGTRLVLVAADWPTRVLPDGEILAPVPGRYGPDGLRPHVRGSLTFRGGPGSSIVLDGLLVDGDVVVGAGELSSLSVAATTVAGALRVESAPGEANPSLQVRVERSILGRVELAPTVPAVTFLDTVVVPQTLAAPPADGLAVLGAGAQVCMEGTTIRGGIASRTLSASSCVLDGQVTVEHRQVGCVRFSFVGTGSRTPRRFRCVPADGGAGPPVPVYLSTDPGAPAYPALASSCSPAIRTGGEGESEMGVHHHVMRPPRRRALDRQLAPYLPVGTQLGIFGG